MEHVVYLGKVLLLLPNWFEYWLIFVVIAYIGGDLRNPFAVKL